MTKLKGQAPDDNGKCRCERCGKRLTATTNFYTFKDGSKSTICKACLTAHVDNFEPGTFMWILEKMDVPSKSRVVPGMTWARMNASNWFCMAPSFEMNLRTDPSETAISLQMSLIYESRNTGCIIFADVTLSTKRSKEIVRISRKISGK